MLCFSSFALENEENLKIFSDDWSVIFLVNCYQNIQIYL